VEAPGFSPATGKRQSVMGFSPGLFPPGLKPIRIDRYFRRAEAWRSHPRVQDTLLMNNPGLEQVLSTLIRSHILQIVFLEHVPEAAVRKLKEAGGPGLHPVGSP
jgi:hypothetical protein